MIAPLISLECVASGSPEPSISWVREDGREIRINKSSSGRGIKKSSSGRGINKSSSGRGIKKSSSGRGINKTRSVRGINKSSSGRGINKSSSGRGSNKSSRVVGIGLHDVFLYTICSLGGFLTVRCKDLLQASTDISFCSRRSF